jgi:poly-beta-1,6-N-acetyl-D-glucosamine synthase
MDAFRFLNSLDLPGLMTMFWYVLIFELPRYTLGALAVTAVTALTRQSPDIDVHLSISVLLIGHNEEKSLRTCIESLGEQTILTRNRLEIIVVNDGSTDRMADIAGELRREGRIDHVLNLTPRGGKSAGINAGISVSTGDIVIVADIDTTFDRDALVELTRFFFPIHESAASAATSGFVILPSP